MASISDELRRLTNSDSVRGHMFVALQDIADRIDSEMVELPKDRDGKPIHIGDTVYAHGFPDGNGGATCEVCGIEFNEGREISIEITTSGIVTYRTPLSLTHELPDSWERIADELEGWSESNRINGSGEVFYRASDLADRIRKLADRECE